MIALLSNIRFQLVACLVLCAAVPAYRWYIMGLHTVNPLAGICFFGCLAAWAVIILYHALKE